MGLGAAAVLLIGILVFVFSSGSEREADQSTAERPQVVPPVAEPAANRNSNTAVVPPAVTPATGTEPLTAPDAEPNKPADKSSSVVAETPKLPTFVEATVNDITEPDSHFLVIDQRFRIRLDRKPMSLKFFLAKRGQQPPASVDEWITVAALEANDEAKQRDLTLAAAMTESQKVMILRDDSFARLKTLVLPVTVQIGSEVLQIVAIDDFKEIAEVRRSSGIYHKVSEPIRILPQGEEPASMTSCFRPPRCHCDSSAGVIKSVEVGKAVWAVERSQSGWSAAISVERSTAWTSFEGTTDCHRRQGKHQTCLRSCFSKALRRSHRP